MPTKLIGMRLPEDILKRVDAHVARMKAERPGVDYTKTDAVRDLLTRGLDTVEGKKKPPKKR